MGSRRDGGQKGKALWNLLFVYLWGLALDASLWVYVSREWTSPSSQGSVFSLQKTSPDWLGQRLNPKFPGEKIWLVQLGESYPLEFQLWHNRISSVLGALRLRFDPPTPGVKNLVLLQLLHRLQQWLGSDPWPRELHRTWGGQKGKKKSVGPL